MTSSSTPQPMAQGDLMARSGARFCETHQRWECAAKKENHHASAIRGLAYCKNCAGRSTAMAKALGEANLLAWSSEAAGQDVAMPDPGLTVLQQLRVASLRADLFGLMLRWQLEVDEEQGLVGDTYTAGVEGGALRTGEQVRGLVRLEAEWRDRTVRYAKTAHDMGIAEREVRVAERTGQQLAGAIRSILEQLELTEAQQMLAIAVVPQELRRLSGETVPGEAEEVAGDADPT